MNFFKIKNKTNQVNDLNNKELENELIKDENNSPSEPFNAGINSKKSSTGLKIKKILSDIEEKMLDNDESSESNDDWNDVIEETQESNVLNKNQDDSEKDKQPKIANKAKKHTFDIQMMNFYYKNQTVIFRVSIGLLVLMLFMFMVFIIIPTETKNGVKDTYLKQENGVNFTNKKNVSEMDKMVNVYQLTIISSNYSMEKTKLYTNQILNFIDKNPDQRIYNKTYRFLLEICKKPKNKNTAHFFNALKEKMFENEIVSQLDADNTILKSNLEICKEELTTVIDEKSLSYLEQRKAIVLNKLAAIKKQREFNKQVYGDAYDVETGVHKYMELNEQERKKNEEEQKLIKELNQELKKIEKNIRDKIERDKITNSASDVKVESTNE